MSKIKPYSIAEVGFQNHLNNKRLKHNGFGYDDWVFFVEVCKFGPEALRRIFGVSWKTAKNWLMIYRS